MHGGVFCLDCFYGFVDYTGGVFGCEEGRRLDDCGRLFDDYEGGAGVYDCDFLAGNLVKGSNGFIKGRGKVRHTVWISVTGMYSVEVWLT